MSSSTGTCGNTSGWWRIISRCVFLSLFRYQAEVAAVPMKLSHRCFGNVGLWSCSRLYDSSCTLLSWACTHTDWSSGRGARFLTRCHLSYIGRLLFLLPLHVHNLSEHSQMGPFLCECLLWLQRVCFQTSAH